MDTPDCFTNLHTLAAGAPMNIEADVLVKLAAMQMQGAWTDGTRDRGTKEFELTAEWLAANGY